MRNGFETLGCLGRFLSSSHDKSRKCPKELGTDTPSTEKAMAGVARRAVARITRRDRYPRASQAHLVFNSWRSFPHASRDRAAICRNLLAGSLSDVCWRLPDAGFLPEVPRMDSLEVRGQPHLRTAFILRVECFGLRSRDFSSAPDLFSGSFIRTASLDRQKITVISDVRVPTPGGISHDRERANLKARKHSD